MEMTTDLRQLYARELCAFQLKVYQFHTSRSHDKCCRYFSSTSLKWQLGNLMVVASIDNQGYTITEISKILCCSRQQATRMIDDCVAEGWVVIVDRLCYQGSDTFRDSIVGEYLDAYLTVLETSSVIKVGRAYRDSIDVTPSSVEIYQPDQVQRMNDELQKPKQNV